MKSQMSTFIVRGIVYTHFIDTETDETTLESDDTGLVLYKVTSDAYLFEGTTMIGRFHLNKDHTWSAVMLDGREFTYRTADLILTEEKLFTELLK